MDLLCYTVCGEYDCKSKKRKNMNEKQQILFMQIRILRMMAENYSLSLREAADIFGQYDVLPFIRESFGIFHVEGDEAVFEEVKSYLQSKGVAV